MVLVVFFSGACGVVCLRGVLAVRVSSSMKRGKKAEEAAAEGENDTASGTTSMP